MKDELLRYNNDQKYLIFDFETCNLNLVNPANKPWQLSFITCTKNKILEKHDHFLKWKNLKVSDGAQKATRFDHTKYRIKSEDPLPILRKFDKLLYDKQYKIVGHNLLGFDIYIHNTFRKVYKFKSDFSYLSRLIDTNSLSKAFKEDIKFDKLASILNNRLDGRRWISSDKPTISDIAVGAPMHLHSFQNIQFLPYII